MKILVTGANGYIGSHLVRALCRKDVQVLALDIDNCNIDKRIFSVSCDIFNLDGDIYKQFNNPDVVIHLAWKDGFKHNSPYHVYSLSQHCKFIEKLVSGGLRRLVVMGSMHETGYYEGAIDENTPCNPISMYGIAKDAFRRYCLSLSSQLDFELQWLRGFYLYGDDLGNNSIFQKLLLAARSGETEFPFTSGRNKYDFINIDEFALQISAVAMQNEICGIINCCSGKPVSLANQVEKFIKENNLNIQLLYGKFPDRSYDSPALWGDNKKILKILENHA